VKMCAELYKTMLQAKNQRILALECLHIAPAPLASSVSELVAWDGCMHQKSMSEGGGQEGREQRGGKHHGQQAVAACDAQEERRQELTQELGELERACAEARQQRSSVIAETEAVRCEYETAWRILRKIQSKIDTQQALPAPPPSPAPRVMRDVGVDARVTCAAASSNTEREWAAGPLRTSQATAGDTQILSVQRSSVRVSMWLPRLPGDQPPRFEGNEPPASIPDGQRPASPCCPSRAAPASTGRGRLSSADSAVIWQVVACAGRARARKLVRLACSAWQACVVRGRVRRRAEARWAHQRRSGLFASWRRALKTRLHVSAACLQVPPPVLRIPAAVHRWRRYRASAASAGRLARRLYASGT